MDRDLPTILGNTDSVEGGCMVWKRALNSDGYPRALIDKNPNAKVHRVVYSIINPDEDITNLVIRHTCDNPKCINPDHLISGSISDNVNDRVTRGRSRGHVSEELIDAIRNLYLDNTFKEIAKALNIKVKRVEYIINRYIK